MALNRLGDFIELVDKRNEAESFSLRDVRGISTSKQFIETKANLDGVNLRTYKIVGLNEFAYVADTSRRGEKIALAFCRERPCLISGIYTVFRVRDESQLLPAYLMMFFNRPEFDRYARFNSWGSARETFSWEDFCAIELLIPPIEIQRKYVSIYESVLANFRAYETGLEDLKLVCDSFIESLRRTTPASEIGPHIFLLDRRNKNGTCTNVKSVSIKKSFNEVGAKVDKTNLYNYKIVPPQCISYVQTTGNEKCFAFAINDTEEDILVTSVNNVFKTDSELNPYYLGLWFRRKEFDRYARFISWGSARETVSWEDLCQVRIPIPKREIQDSIVACYTVLAERIKKRDELKKLLSRICPILIRGSVEEASRL